MILNHPVVFFAFQANASTAEPAIPTAAIRYTLAVAASPNSIFELPFNTAGDINCPRLIALVNMADAMAVAAGGTALATLTIPVGIKTPWEKPQNKAPK